MIQGAKTMAFRWIGKKSGPADMGGAEDVLSQAMGECWSPGKSKRLFN